MMNNPVVNLSGRKAATQSDVREVATTGGSIRGQTTLYIGTFNCRSLRGEDRLIELLQSTDKIKWDVIGLSEVRRKEEELITLKNGNTFFYKGTDDGRTSGVGFLINKKWHNNIVKLEGISDRIAKLTLSINERYSVQIIQVYAPTSTCNDDEIDEFYDMLGREHDKDNNYFKMIIGDFNAKVGVQEPDDVVVGKFGLGERNVRGHRMVDFAESTDMYVCNTYFQKHPSRKWTWKGPNGIKNEIDYILTNKLYSVTNCEVLNNFTTSSDHRLVRSTVKLNTRVERIKLIKTKKQTINVTKLQAKAAEFQIQLKNRFSILEEDETETRLMEEVKRAAEEVGNTPTKPRVQKLKEETRQLMNTRRQLKNKDGMLDRIQFVEVSKQVRKAIKDDVAEYNEKIVQHAIENNKSLKKAKHHLMIGRKQILALQKPDGTLTHNRHEIIKIIEDFYSNLYKNTNTDKGNIDQTSTIHDTQDIPSVLADEVRVAINSMKNGKSGGADGVLAEYLKLGGPVVEDILAKIFTKCFRRGNIPSEWNHARIVLLHKKGSKAELRNYRPISLLPVIYKVFMKILTNRLKSVLDSTQPREQAGFRTGFSTMDHIHTLQEIISRTNEYEMPLVLCFVDYTQAFDSISTSSVLDALSQQGVRKGYINLLRNIYKSATSSVLAHEQTDAFKIEKGVRQGDCLSPILFTAALEEVFKTLPWDKEGLRINGEYLSHLRFADDIVLLANNANELCQRLVELNAAGKKIGLTINMSKTKVMFNKYVAEQDIQFESKNLEQCTEYIYLGQLISTGDDCRLNEINRRIKLGWRAFGQHSHILKSKMPIHLKRKVFNQCILPVLTYGSETWVLNAICTQRLQTTQRSMERCMLGITRKDRKRNTWVRERTGVTDIIERVRSLKWMWAGHVARRDDNRWTALVTNWAPRDVKRPRRRPRDRWSRDIVKYLGVTWQRAAQDRNEWKNLREAYIHRRIENG